MWPIRNKQPDLTKIVPISIENHVKDWIRRSFTDSDVEKALDWEYLDKLALVRIDIHKSFWKVFTLYYATILVLCLNYAVGNAEISAFGIAIKNIGEFREPLLVFASILLWILASVRIRLRTVTAAIDVIGEKLTSPSAWSIIGLRYLGVHSTPKWVNMFKSHPPHLLPTRLGNFQDYVVAFGNAICLLAIFAIIAIVPVYVSFDIFVNPSYSWWFSSLVVMFYFSAGLVRNFIEIPMVFRDYSELLKWGDIRKTDPNRAKEYLKEAWAQASIKRTKPQ